MNQTDLQGETERALRAAACALCECSPLSLVRKGGHYASGNGESFIGPCTYNPKLLPLFNAGMERAVLRYEKALVSLTPLGSEYVGDPEKCAAYIRERQQSLQDQVIRQVKLRQEAENSIAGAYAAAAKHFPRMPFLCNCGFTLKDAGDGKAISEQWAEHIRALTPADARQAQSGERMDCGHPVACQIVSDDASSIYSDTPKLCGWCHDKAKLKIAAEKLKVERAAIASAEARARLEGEQSMQGIVEKLSRKWRLASREQISGGYGQCADELEAAARTPDSTKEPE